jgi:LemA protein
MITQAVAIIIGCLFLIGVIIYNDLVKFRNRAKEAWADIDVQLRRRYNLIPNLIETVKGYAKHEKEIFNKVAMARAKAMGTSDVKEKGKAENQLTNTLKTLFAVSEEYPQLKASDNFSQLQTELRDTEDKIQAARRFYNSNVRDFNTKVESFPVNLVAKFSGFGKMKFFTLKDKDKRKVPETNF